MIAGGELVDETAIAMLPAGAGVALAARLPAGADPDEVRDWFELETIVELPAPAASFAEAEAAAADYRRAARADNTRRAYRSGVAAFTEWCAVHAQTALPAAPATVAAFLAAEAGRGLAVNTLRLRHAALRYLHLLGRLSAADRLAVGVGDLCRHPPRSSPAIAQKDRPRRRTIARRTQGDPRHLAGVARPGLAPGRLCRRITTLGIGAARYRVADPPRGRHRPVPAMAQKRSGGAWHNCVAAGRADRSLSGDSAREPGSPPPRSATARCSGDCGGCRHRASARVPGESWSPTATGLVPTRSIPISIALVVKKWTGRAGLDGAAFAGHSLRRGAISSGVAQGVHIARLKQFSGHASLKSLEEYVELDELRQHHPLKDLL